MAMKPVMILMPELLIKELDRLAKRLPEMTRSSLIRKLLREGLKKRRKNG